MERVDSCPIDKDKSKYRWESQIQNFGFKLLGQITKGIDIFWPI